LQPPFYDNKMDDAVNFGAIGAVIGHELTHGFDDQGRQFDAAGNLRDWWTEEDAKAFEKRAQCFVDQYGSFTAVDNVKLNGKLTLGENTADNGGLRIAYMALMDTLAGKTPAQARRIRRRAALVPGLGTGVVHQPIRRERADPGAEQRTLHGPVPRERRRPEHAGISESLRLQGRPAGW
jgi:hypothetical protein